MSLIVLKYIINYKNIKFKYKRYKLLLTFIIYFYILIEWINDNFLLIILIIKIGNNKNNNFYLK